MVTKDYIATCTVINLQLKIFSSLVVYLFKETIQYYLTKIVYLQPKPAIPLNASGHLCHTYLNN